MTPWKLALLNLLRRKVPTFLVVGAIAVAVACSGISWRVNILASSRFQSLGKGGEAIVGAKSGGIDILLGALNSEGEYPGFLPRKLYDTLKSSQTVKFEDGAQSNASYIKSIIPLLYFAKYQDTRIVATDKDFFERPGTQDSLSFEEGQWSEAPGDIVVGVGAAQKYGLKVGDLISARAWFGEDIFAASLINLKVSGILKKSFSTWDRLIYTNFSTSQSVLHRTDLRAKSIWGPEVLNYFLIYLQPQGFEPLKALVNSRTVGQVIDVQIEKARLENLVGAGKNLGLLLAVLVLVQGGLCMASMLITRFEAMNLQLAILRAVGYKKSELGRWLLFEGLLIGSWACVIGMALDFIFFPMVCNLLGTAVPAQDIVAVSLLWSFPVWMMTLLATTLAVIVPLYRVYHQDVHFSLRG